MGGERAGIGSPLSEDHRAVLLNLARMKLWHLARQHVSADGGVGRAAASLSSPRRTRPALFKTEAMKDSWRLVGEEDVTRGGDGARSAVMINSHVGYFH